MNAVATDLFHNGVTPQLRVRLNQPLKDCCDNVAIVTPGKGPHAAELRCAGCDAHRGWLAKTALDFIIETSRRHGAPAEITWRDRTISIGDQTMTTAKKYDNSGILFRNDEKDGERDRDYSGSITVSGVEYWLSAWIKEGKRGKFMTLSVKPKNESLGAAKPKTSAADEMSDDIPF
jgi:hypothetical protein